MRILFFATYPTQPTGYARVGNILTNYLASIGHTIYYLGISNWETSAINRSIHPNIHLIDALKERKTGSTELYGVDIFCDVIERVNPDLLFIYNDIIVISRIINDINNRKIIKSFKTCIYLDLVYEYEKIDLINHVNNFADHIFVFSQCWKTHLMHIGIDERKLFVLPHGINQNEFYPIENVRSNNYFEFGPDDFVVLNSNRNSYRKAIDITIEAFAIFLKKNEFNPKIKLFLNLNMNASEYNITDLIKVIALKLDIDYNLLVNNHMFIRNRQTYLSDAELNILYNTCDIGLNTCIGEGFGMCNLEHGAIGKPQVISNVGGLVDIFANDYATLINPVAEFYISDTIDWHGGYAKVGIPTDFANALDKYYHSRELGKIHGERARNTILENYQWDTILKSLSYKLNTMI